MSVEPRVVQRAALCRRDFLLGSAALSAALLLPGVARADVRQLAGNVRVNGKRATGKTRIRAGDTVDTGAGSKLVFVIGQDAFLLREKSKINFEKAGAGKGASISGLRVVRGALLAVFGKGARRIQTDTATAEIRGTGVYVEAGANQTYFCTCYGDVDLRDKSGKARKMVVSGYHTPHVVYARVAEGAMIVSANLRHHTDDELIMLERLVGRTSPILQRDQRLKEGAEPEPTDTPQETPAREAPSEPAREPPAEPARVEPAPPRAEPQPAPETPVEAPPRRAQPRPAPETPAKPAPRRRAPPRPAPEAPAEAAPVPSPEPPPAPPEQPTQPAEPEYRLPPPRLD